MKIIVCIKQVPETANIKIDPKTNTLIREGVASIINPFDMYAIEEAIRIKERLGAEVTVITMGPPQAESALREAIAMGCDQGILITDRAFAGSDTWATSYTLAQAIRKIDAFDTFAASKPHPSGCGKDTPLSIPSLALGIFGEDTEAKPKYNPQDNHGLQTGESRRVDLIICGKQAIDGDTAQVGPGISVQLDIPQVTYVKKIERIDEKSVRVERMVEAGYEIIDLPLPCLFTVVKEINEPRLPSLKGKMRAKAAQIIKWGSKDIAASEERIGLAGSPTQVIKIFTPPPRQGGQILTGTTSEVVDKLVNALRDVILGCK